MPPSNRSLLPEQNNIDSPVVKSRLQNVRPVSNVMPADLCNPRNYLFKNAMKSALMYRNLANHGSDKGAHKRLNGIVVHELFAGI